MEYKAKQFFLILGAISLIHFIIEYPYSLYTGTEFVYDLSTFFRYVVISLVIVLLLSYRPKSKHPVDTSDGS